MVTEKDALYYARLNNPVRKVKFFRKIKVGVRVVSVEEEERLLRNAAPYLQDLIRFALNTGLRTGELFSLRWSNVDMEKTILNVFAPKTQKARAVPINSEARKVLDASALDRKGEFVSIITLRENRLLTSNQVSLLRVERRGSRA
jgi:integrase